MKGKIILICSVLLLAITAPSLVSAEIIMPVQQSTNSEDAKRYLKMADNFIVIYDPSSAMAEPYKDTGKTRLEAEKEILIKGHEHLPQLNWQAGLYANWKGGMWLHGATKGFQPYFNLQNYDHSSYADAIHTLPTIPTGPPMLQRGLMKLSHLLPLDGRTEIFFFSDGQHTTEDDLEPEPLITARELAEKYDVCFTIISSAQTEDDKQLLQEIASVNSCSQVMEFDTLYDKPEHLFGKLYMDRNQPSVLFDFDKHIIKDEYKPTLAAVGSYLQNNPGAYAALSGFTCNIGTERYNKKLSRQRAESVQGYLMKNFNIKEERLLLYWYGPANPVASNDTEKGRRLNRRVSIDLRETKEK
jgi:OOP family OmpA-OmpF porin